jgi:hypothetical protein
MVGDGLRRVGIIPEDVNISNLTPRDITDLGIYTDTFERITRIK